MLVNRAAEPGLAHSGTMASLYQHHGCILWFLLVAALWIADAAHPEPMELSLYGRHGSDILIPGVETELQGEGVVEWQVKKAGDPEPQWILTHHYGSNEAETYHKYKHRVLFSFTNASLRLSNLTHHDDGLYILLLMNVDARHVQLRVIEPVSDVMVMNVLSSGDSVVRLMCEASGDVWNLTWWNNGRELMQDTTREGNTSELVIKEVGAGSYTCVAWNPVSQLEKPYQIVQESTVILYVVGLLTAAVVFGLPFALSELFLFVCRNCQKCSCESIEQKAIECQRTSFVCWFLFLICALVSTTVGQFFSVSYAHPVFHLVLWVALVSSLCTESLWLTCKKWTKSQSQDNWIKKMINHKKFQRMKGTLNLFRLVLFLGSLSLLLSYFSVDVRGYGKQPHLHWTFSFAVLLPLVVFILIYCCCRPNGPISRWLDKSNIQPSAKPTVAPECAEEMELGIPLCKDGHAAFNPVPNDEPGAT